MEVDSEDLSDGLKPWSIPEDFPPLDSTSPAVVTNLRDLTHQQLLEFAAKHNQQQGMPDDPFAAVLKGIPERAKLRPGSKQPESYYMGVQGLRPHGKYAKAWRKILRGTRDLEIAVKAPPAKVGCVCRACPAAAHPSTACRKTTPHAAFCTHAMPSDCWIYKPHEDLPHHARTQSLSHYYVWLHNQQLGSLSAMLPMSMCVMCTHSAPRQALQQQQQQKQERQQPRGAKLLPRRLTRPLPTSLRNGPGSSCSLC